MAVRVNGAHDMAATDANGNGPATTTYEMCNVCGAQSNEWFYCQSCTDVETATRSLCQTCWQRHQLDVHVLARHSTTPTAAAAAATPSAQLDVLRTPPADEHQQLLTASTSTASSMLRQMRPRLMMTSRDEQCLSTLLGDLVMHAATAAETCSTSSWVVETTSSSSNIARAPRLLAAGLHDPSTRHRRLVTLQAPVARQYEAWLWQALNNGGFEQAVHSIDERKQQIGVNLQSTLRDMEFRLERARVVLDESYREYMRQVIEVSRCQVEALHVQSETLQRVRAAAARLQHARVYNDETRALLAECELASALRHNATSTCLRPCDDGWIEFRSPTDEQLRAYLRSSCLVDSRVHAAHCSVQSIDRDLNCLSWTVLGRVSEFEVLLRNHCHAGVDDAALSVLIADNHGAELSYQYQRRSAGHYVVRYRAQSPGTHHIYVLLRDRHLADSPYTVCYSASYFTC